MSSVSIPQKQWREFLQEFSRRHHGWLVTVETHDLETAEDVASRFLPLQSITLDLEDEKNPRINVTVRSDEKEIRQILFRPSEVVLYRSARGDEEAVRVVSINTSTTIRFRVATSPELVDGVA
ncbi:MAG: hypothetical protein DMG11_24015 [Acidobacteria bacterium]|nr:MAG: hypothetical protein DMG11_24015 [Acidobacteriota bacterium]